MAKTVAALLVLLQLLAGARAAKEIFNYADYNATDEAAPVYEFKFLTTASTDGIQFDWTRLDIGDALNQDVAMYVGFEQMPDPADSSTFLYARYPGGGVEVASQYVQEGWWYVKVYPESPQFVLSVYIFDSTANVVSLLLFFVLCVLLVAGKVLKAFAPHWYERSYGLLISADDVVKECRQKLDLEAIKRRGIELAAKEQRRNKVESNRQRWLMVAFIVLLAVLAAFLRFFVLALNASMVFSSLNAISSPLVVPVDEFTGYMDSALGFVGKWIDGITSEFDGLDLLDTVRSTTVCEDVIILGNTCIFVLMVMVLTACMRGDVLLFVAVYLEGLASKQKGRMNRILWLAGVKAALLATLYSVQIGVLSGSQSGFAALRLVTGETRTCNTLGGMIGTFGGIMLFMPFLLLSAYYCLFLFGGNRLESRGLGCCHPMEDGWERKVPKVKPVRGGGSKSVCMQLVCAHITDALGMMRFAAQRLLKASVGYWSSAQVRSYRIEQRALKFDDDDDDDDTKHEAVIRTVGRSVSLLWCAIPGCVMIAKLGEAANNYPVFVTDPDILLHTPSKRRWVMWFANVMAWLVMMLVVFMPDQVGPALLVLSAAPELFVDVYTVLVDEFRDTIPDILGLGSFVLAQVSPESVAGAMEEGAAAAGGAIAPALAAVSDGAAVAGGAIAQGASAAGEAAKGAM